MGLDQLSGEYRLGYYYSTADALDINTISQTSHKHGMWVVAKQQLTTHQGDAKRGLTGFVNLTVHDSNTNQVGNMQNIGLAYTGLMDTRPQDQLAFGVARIRMNDDLNDGRREEYDAEVYYGLHANNWLTIRPNIQYIRHVGAYKDGENVWVGGIKLQTVF